MPGESKPLLELLPTEILEEIFQHLDYKDLNSAALVSKGLKRVAEFPKYWRKIQLEVAAKDFEKVMNISRLSQLEGLVLKTGDNINTKIIFNFQPSTTT